MIMTEINNIHPGEILESDFLDAMEITPYRLAKSIGMQQIGISMIIRGKRGITPDTAIRFSKFFGTTPEFWLNLQREYSLRVVKSRNKDILDAIVPYAMGA